MKFVALFVVLLVGCSKLEQNITAEQFKKLMDKDDVTVIDARTPSEFQMEHIVGAKNFDIYAADTPLHIAELDKEKTYLVYCRSGRRSLHMTTLMAKLGFQVHNLLNGFSGWKEKGLPTQ